jgi:3',5'-cyclic AMP phosphodiesterase CpdA
MRVIQISDTHLSADKRHFADDWAPLAQWIAAERPVLVVHTGDLTVDGAGSAADLDHCAALPGEARLGAVRYEFHRDRFAAEIVGVPSLVPHWLDDVIDEVYPWRPEREG